MTLVLASRCGSLHDLEMIGDGFAHALHFHQPGAGRRDHFGKAAEARQKRLGQGLGVAPGQGGEQGQFQKLVIGHGIGAAVQETRAQPLPMTFAARVGGARWREGNVRLVHAGLRCKVACAGPWATA
jgi:hypothetical protein